MISKALQASSRTQF